MSKEIKIGLFSILIVVSSILGYRFLKGENPLGGAKTIYARFENIDQLAVSAPVLIRGLQVGTVIDRFLDPKDHDYIVVEMAIEKEFGIPKDAIASLQSASLVGGKLIVILYDNPCEGNCITEGSYLQGRSPNIIATMIGEENIDELGVRLKASFQKAMNDSTGSSEMMVNFEEITKNLEEITSALSSHMASINSNLDASLRNMRDISQNFKDNEETFNRSIKNIDVLTTKLKDLDLDKTLDLTNQTFEGITSSLTGLDETMIQTKESIQKLDQIVQKINSGDGSMGRLINDPKLYENIENTTRELNLLLQDFRLNPKRYVNVSVFGKKQKNYEVPENDPAIKAEK